MPRLWFRAALALAFVVAVPAAAQEATLAALPATPEPGACRVEPRPVAFVEEAIRRAVASPAPIPTFSPAGGTVTPTPLAVAEEGSRPADAETVAVATATVREYFACINAGDTARLLALHTEQPARDNVAFLLSGSVRRARAEGTPPAALQMELLDGYRASLSAPPAALPADLRAGPVAIANVRALPNGSVVADVVAASPGGDGQGGVLLVEEGGRLLIARITASLPSGAPVP